MKFGFIGPSYTGRAKSVDAERCVNLFLEKSESAEAKAAACLIGTPGLSSFATMANPTNGRGIYLEPQTQRVFAVTNNILYEIPKAGGAATNRGTFNEVPGLTSKVSFCSNGTQMVIASNNTAYVYTLATNALQQLNAVNFPNLGVNQPGAGGLPGSSLFDFFDTYLLALDPNTQSFYWSFVNDATDWSALNFANKTAWPDNLVGFIQNQRRLWLFGNQRAEPWYDDGSSPFSRDQAGQIEVGLAAQSSLHRADNAIVWLGQDDKGTGIVYKNNQYQPQRISNHAIEFQLSQYGSISDCEAWGEQHGGHVWSVFYFPSGDATWVYDHSTSMWHQRTWLDPDSGMEHANLARGHALAFGKHLVADRQSGTIYTQSLDTFTDNGNPRKWTRACPVFQEHRYIHYKQLVLYVTSGLGLSSGQGSAPIVNLRISDDGGFTWGNDIPESLGALGDYAYRINWQRLGRSRDRVFEVSSSEPIPIQITEAYLEAA